MRREGNVDAIQAGRQLQLGLAEGAGGIPKVTDSKIASSLSRFAVFSGMSKNHE